MPETGRLGKRRNTQHVAGTFRDLRRILTQLRYRLARAMSRPALRGTDAVRLLRARKATGSPISDPFQAVSSLDLAE